MKSSLRHSYLSKDRKGLREGAIWISEGRAVQAEGTVRANALWRWGWDGTMIGTFKE